MKYLMINKAKLQSSAENSAENKEVNMLKIKDDIDLKELEKFGFKPKYSEDTGNIIAYERYKYDKRYEDIIIIKYEKVRTFRIFRTPTKKIEWRIIPYDTYFDLDLIYDLIKAGLVEKV